MARRVTFSQFLIGSASLERPSFFYAYSGMWLHLFLGLFLLALFGSRPLLDYLSSMVFSSLSAALILYGLLSREYGLLVNLGSYALSLLPAFRPGPQPPALFLVAVIVGLGSGYFLLSREYRRYSREVYSDEDGGLPVWMTVLMSTVLLLLFIYGISLI